MLSILIVNWNTLGYLRACLASLETACASLEHEIIVVDNASHDGSAAMVSTFFPHVFLVASKKNLGFAAGNNLAFEKSRGQWIWLLNPDTEVLRDAAQTMIAFLEANALQQSTPQNIPQSTRRGAVASALIDARTQKPQKSCRTFPTPAALWAEASLMARKFPRSRSFGFYKMGWWDYRDARRVEQPMASSFMMRREAIESIYDAKIGGLFDENFPIFFNDVDLCWRLNRCGWEIWYLPQAEVLHHGGASTQQVKSAMIEESHRSLRLFYEKHYRSILSPPLYYATVALMEAGGALRLRGLRAKKGVQTVLKNCREK